MDIDTRSVGGSVEELATTARELTTGGDPRRAIQLLTEANRAHRSPILELALAEVRHRGFEFAEPTPVATPGAAGVELELIDGMPSVPPAGLSAAVLSQALASHGCLFVPGLLESDAIDRLVDGIDRSFDAFDRHAERPMAPRSDDDRSWFEPFTPSGGYASRVMGGRSFTRTTGGMWTIESPRMLFELTELFDAIGLTRAIAGHLGEQPALSAAKCNIRRTPVHLPGGWHQDGSFVGLDITSVDAWIALSDCGRDAPGLDLVPHRFHDLLPTGPDGVVIPHETVLERIADLGAGIVDREFAAGDALLFDHLFLHRTAISPEMTRERYALETWFFGPSRYPPSQVPILY